MATALSIANPDTIQSLLENSQDQRSKFFISLPRELSSLTDLSGVLREITEHHLTIEISSLRADPVTWVTQSVTCYFSVRDQVRKTDIFYNFTMPIQDTSVFRGNYNLILGRPTRLNIGQRRSSIRLEPASGDILGFSLWEEGMLVASCPEEDRVKLCDPVVQREHADKGMAAIRNISAGGIRLYLSNKLLSTLQQEFQQDWNRGTRLVLWLALADKSTTGHHVHWVKGRIRYRQEDYLNKDAEFGIEFTYHGKNDQNGRIVWNPVKQNIIQELGAWVYQLYLERFRRGRA